MSEVEKLAVGELSLNEKKEVEEVAPVAAAAEVEVEAAADAVPQEEAVAEEAGQDSAAKKKRKKRKKKKNSEWAAACVCCSYVGTLLISDCFVLLFVCFLKVRESFIFNPLHFYALPRELLCAA